MLRRRAFVPALCAVVASGAVALGSEAQAGSTLNSGPSTLTSEELATATAVARFQASGTTPDAPGLLVKTENGAWPSNVTKVSALAINRAATADWVGLKTTEDDRRVIVVELRGKFAALTTGPKGANTTPTGTAVIEVADARTGEFLDYTFDEGDNPIEIPGATVVYTAPPG